MSRPQALTPPSAKRSIFFSSEALPFFANVDPNATSLHNYIHSCCKLFYPAFLGFSISCSITRSNIVLPTKRRTRKRTARSCCPATHWLICGIVATVFTSIFLRQMALFFFGYRHGSDCQRPNQALDADPLVVFVKKFRAIRP